jgi:hypothetical protein
MMSLMSGLLLPHFHTPQVESRFRFLAADSSSTLSGQWPSYRQVLLSARHR